MLPSIRVNYFVRLFYRFPIQMHGRSHRYASFLLERQSFLLTLCRPLTSRLCTNSFYDRIGQPCGYICYCRSFPQNLFNFEFIKTVQRVPKSQGCKAIQAERAKSDTLYFNVRAKVSMNEPHPDEQASFSSMRVIAPCLTKIAFMSCPPMSRMKETSGAICRAAR